VPTEEEEEEERGNVENFCKAREDTNDNMTHAQCTLDK
jgi:hypothetical protein